MTRVIPDGVRSGFFDRFADQGIPIPDPDGLHNPNNVAATIAFPATTPAGSVIQENLVTP